jgi:hypothetical protein
MNKTIGLKSGTAFFALLIMMFTATANAVDYDYVGGLATTCTSTCDSFASLTAPPFASSLQGSLEIDVGASDTFTAADVTSFSFVVTSPSAPLEPYDGSNPTTANPLPVDSSVAVIEASNTAGDVTTGGSTDANGEITGTVLFRFTVAPFSDNGAWVIFDLETGTAQVCLFFDTSGCIPAATETVVFETQAFSASGGGSFEFNGGASVVCTSTCDSFASLTGPPTPSTLSGSVNISVGASASFTASDVTAFNFQVGSPSAPFEPFDGTNATTANPLPVNASVAVVRASNTAGDIMTGGNTDANGEITDGTILFEFTQPPFSDNGAWVIFDVGTGKAQVCLFFDTSGCIPGATETVIFEVPGFPLDSDGDGVLDRVDNCINLPNADQRDTNGDGHGNRCDADLNNADCVVNPIDLGLFKSVFFTGDADADFNGDGVVNPIDLGIFKSLFFTTPGVSAAPNACGNL